VGVRTHLFIFKSDVHAVFHSTSDALYLNVYFNLCAIMLPFSFGNGILLACDLLQNSRGKFLKIKDALKQDKKWLQA